MPKAIESLSEADATALGLALTPYVEGIVGVDLPTFQAEIEAERAAAELAADAAEASAGALGFFTAPNFGFVRAWTDQYGHISMGIATRKVVVEGQQMLLANVFINPADTLVAPTTTPPLAAFIGTSITEAADSWACWLQYALGVDGYNLGTGGTGVLTNGPRVRLRRRSLDYTAPNFSLAIDESGINDSNQTGVLDNGTSGNIYADMSYGTVFQTFCDEYRRNLDLWFAAHPNSPWIAWGPYWPNASFPVSLYAIRDAKQRALEEYRLGGFIDTLNWPIIPGASGSEPVLTYIQGDNTHPTGNGSEHIAASLLPHIEQMLRTF